MVEQQTRVRESTAGDERRLRGLRTRYRTLVAFAVGLITIGLVMSVTAFVLVLQDRDDGPRGTTIARQVADQLADADVGCEDFNGNRPTSKAILQEARCTTRFGSLRIVVYKDPTAMRNLQILTHGYQCIAAAAQGDTRIVNVFNGLIRLALPSENLSAAQAYRRAIGGRIETTDCTAPAPEPPPPTTTPPAPPEPAPAPQ